MALVVWFVVILLAAVGSTALCGYLWWRDAASRADSWRKHAEEFIVQRDAARIQRDEAKRQLAQEQQKTLVVPKEDARVGQLRAALEDERKAHRDTVAVLVGIAHDATQAAAERGYKVGE